MKKWLLTIFVIVCIKGFGQNSYTELISASGSVSKNSDIELSWSVGETVMESYTKSNSFILLQGFQQPVLEVNTDLKESKVIGISVYPNPMKNYFNFNLGTEFNNNLSFTIFDSKGEVVLKDNNFNVKSSVNVQKLNVGLYILKIFLNDQTPSQSILIFKNL